MKIGIIADTHLTRTPGLVGSVTHKIRNTRTLEGLHEIVRQHFQQVDLILHAGDFVDLAVFEMLQTIAPVEAVQGNMDQPEIRKRFPAQREITLAGRVLGLTHGEGAPQGISARVRPHFARVDVIVFGHSHQPLNEWRDGILFFNPGSPTDRIFAPYNSLGLLEITDTITGRLLRI